MKYKLIIDKEADEEIVVTVHSPSELTREIENLVRDFSGLDSIVGSNDGGTRRIPFKEIECITVLDRKVIVFDQKGEQYRIQQRLRELEPSLPSYFVRINKSTLANEQQIERFQTVFSGGIDAIFRCGYRDYVSRRCLAELKRRYEKR